MVLKTDVSTAGKTVVGSICPFTTVLASLPVIGPGVKFNCDYTVNFIYYVSVIENYLGMVPFTSRSYKWSCVKIRDIHSIIYSTSLPGL